MRCGTWRAERVVELEIILQAAIGVVFHEAVKRMVNAFLVRARVVYGPPPVTAMAKPAEA